MQFVFEIIISFFLIFGAFFMLVGSIGMIRLPDLFMRLHAPTKSSTLGSSFQASKSAAVVGQPSTTTGICLLVASIINPAI